MRRQRNMAQMKEQIRTPEKELNKMEINNLSNAEFKTLVIRMLKELSGYFNSIKETQAEMKDILTEIKNNLQGINSRVDEAKNQISDLEHKEEKDIQSVQQEEKRTQKIEECKELLGQLQGHQHSHHGSTGRRRERARNWKPT